MSDLIGCTVGPYQVVSRLGEGSMATVYMAYHPAMDRHVALKVPLPRLSRDPFFRSRFQREAQTLAKLEHPYIVPVYDIGEEGDVIYVAMRLIEGGTLRERLQEQPLPVSQAILLASQAAEALAFAHRNGVIHGDVKPSNILIGPTGRALLADFGFAQLLAESLPPTASTSRLGSPDYMAPEQVIGAAVDARTDVYSLGVVFYEVVTGRRPFVAESPTAVSSMHLTTPVSPPREIQPDLPVAVEGIILKAMAKNPFDRFQTADAFAAALTSVSAERAPQTVAHFDALSVPPSLRNSISPAWEARLLALAHAARSGRGPNVLAVGFVLILVLWALVFRRYDAPAAAVAEPATLSPSVVSPTALPLQPTPEAKFTPVPVLINIGASLIPVAGTPQTLPVTATMPPTADSIRPPDINTPDASAATSLTATPDALAAPLPTATSDVSATTVPTTTSDSSGTTLPTTTPDSSATMLSTATPNPAAAVDDTAYPPTAPSETSTATATQTTPYRPRATPTARPTSTPSYAIPSLIGSTSTAGSITLAWSYTGPLGTNDYFDVRVWQDGLPANGIANVQQTTYGIGGNFPGGTYNWTIAVIRKQGGTITTLSQASQTLQFNWNPPAPSGGSGIVYPTR